MTNLQKTSRQVAHHALNTLRLISVWRVSASVLLLVVAIGLQGCKLGMRQKAYIPYQAVAITGAPSQTFLGQLQFDILTYIDIKVAISPVDADLIIEILQDAPNSQIASYTGTGQISAYDINDVVVFRVYDKQGNELIPETQIFGVRDTNFSVSTVLAADIAQQQAIADIRKELAMQITIRLMSLGRQRR
jgi:LPS-assembly lipoprotein